MADISQKTWKYLHGPDDVVHLAFPTGAVPRSFSVIQYTATEREELNFAKNGIAVIDNDTLSVVLDEHLRGRDLEQTRFMSRVRSMGWKDFSSFCTDHPRYRSRAGDMDLPRPDPGILVNQIQRGVMHAPKDETDLRSPSMVAAQADETCPYSFPAANRSQMIAEILSHSCIKDDAGAWRIAWETHLDGAIPAQGSTSPDAEEARAWALHYEGNPEIFHQISGEVFAPYFSGGVATWPKTDAGRYGFSAAGMENADTICLQGIDGVDLGFRSRGELGAFLNDLEDAAIRDLWKLIRVVDHDLSAPVIDRSFAAGLDLAREAFEASRDLLPDPAAEMV